MQGEGEEAEPLLRQPGGEDEEGPFMLDWCDGCLEVDSCCGCCDLQVGAKVIAIMGVVQGLTNCMSISTAGFLAAPTLMIGCLSVGFSLYGFWGAQRLEKKKIRVHCYWLVISALLLVGVSLGRIYTSQQFCETHNCIVDHMFYPNGHHHSDSDSDVRAIPADKFMASNQHSIGTVESNTESSADQLLLNVKANVEDARTTNNGAIPIYREPCYVDQGVPSVDVCTRAHKLSALTTISATVPLNLYFAFIIRSLYKKVRDGLITLPEVVVRPIGRPIQAAQPVPPMTVYEAERLDGAPACGSYFPNEHRSSGNQDSDGQGSSNDQI